MTTPQQAYQNLIQHFKEIALLESITAVLAWDRETYMPSQGAGWRSQQNAYLSGVMHRKTIEPQVGEWLQIAEASDLTAIADADEAVNLREWRRVYDRAVKTPTALVEEFARVTVLAHQTWVEARRRADFSVFQPHLSALVALTRQRVDCLGYDDVPYDALLDEFEPGETTANVKQLFDGLRVELVSLVQAIQGSERRPRSDILYRHYPIDRQQLLGEAAAAAFGYDFRAGRIDTVVHPFCIGIGPGDVRITNRYSLTFFNDAFFGTLHETGHALYSQNLPASAYGAPLGEDVGMGIQESQSRLWENLVGRSHSYWRYFFPRVQQAFPLVLADVTMEDFYFAVNSVKPSFTRVDADEITYNLHIMLRFDLEQAIISGDLQVSDIPGAWNETFENYLGLKVPDDAQGCLQDTHWASGNFGYFPSYALGNLYAAQIFDAARRALPDLEAQIASGDFQPLREWLTTQHLQPG